MLALVANATTIISSVFRAITVLFGRKLTVGSVLTTSVAIEVAPTALAAVDNKLDHAISGNIAEWLRQAGLEDNMTGALETILKTQEWAEDQKASVVSHLKRRDQ